MSYDVVPSGFSSAAAVTLLKTMRSAMQGNSSFLAAAGNTALDTTSKATVSGDTMFSILAAAASAKVATSSGTAKQPAAPASTTSDAVGGQAALASDPLFQKSYTLDQAIDTFYASLHNLAASQARTPGATIPGQTAGQIIAADMSMTGDKAASFATAFDNQTLKFSDINSVAGLNATLTRTYFHASDGEISGGSITMHINEKAYQDYSIANPNSFWGDNYGYQQSAGLLVSW